MDFISKRDTFLNEEERCGCFISIDMKKLWRCQLDLLEFFISICEKYKLQYTLYAGSLLGAVRHHGYIPWDDDLDVAMLRKDYDVFLKVAPKELPSHLFLHTSVNEPGWPCGFAKLRNSNTTALDKRRVDDHSTVNQGIFLDIFPLDLIPKDQEKRKVIFEKYAKLFQIFREANREHIKWLKLDLFRRSSFYKKMRRLIFCFFANTKLLLKLLRYKIVILLNGGNKRFYDKIEDVFRQLPEYECDAIVDCTFCSRLSPNSKVYDKHWYSSREIIETSFEYLTVKIPKEYDKILTRKFGDWHKLVKSGSFHSLYYFSSEESYKQVLISKFGYNNSEF